MYKKKNAEKNDRWTKRKHWKKTKWKKNKKGWMKEKINIEKTMNEWRKTKMGEWKKSKTLKNDAVRKENTENGANKKGRKKLKTAEWNWRKTLKNDEGKKRKTHTKRTSKIGGMREKKTPRIRGTKEENIKDK